MVNMTLSFSSGFVLCLMLQVVHSQDGSFPAEFPAERPDMARLDDMVMYLQQRDAELTATVQTLVDDNKIYAGIIKKLIADNDMLKDITKQLNDRIAESADTIGRLESVIDDLIENKTPLKSETAKANASHDKSSLQDDAHLDIDDTLAAAQTGTSFDDNQEPYPYTNSKKADRGQVSSIVQHDRQERLLLDTEPPVTDNGKERRPSFTARLSQHVTGLGTGQLIVFDDVVTNIGHAYSPVSGTFTTPTNGTYFFFSSIMSHTNSDVQTEIVLNGVAKVFMYSYDKAHEQGSNGVVLDLYQGDLVWVRHRNAEGTQVYGSHWSTFSGFQIL